MLYLSLCYILCPDIEGDKAHIGNFAELKALSGGVDKVGNYFVFNIGGNKLRLIAAIHFNTGKLFIREILTHDEYDEDKWKR